MSEPKTLKLIVATFADEAGAARALATITPALGPGKLGQAAIVSKGPDGKIRFLETDDTTAAQGAWTGAGIGAFAGLLGILFTPVALLGLPIGAAVGALVGKLRDTGFEDDALKAMGEDLDAGHSALVAIVDEGDVEKAERLLTEVNVVRVTVKEVGADLAAVLDDDAAAATGGSPREHLAGALLSPGARRRSTSARPRRSRSCASPGGSVSWKCAVGVPLGRGVAAADVAAGQAQPQVHPAGAVAQALLAALGRVRAHGHRRRFAQVLAVLGPVDPRDQLALDRAALVLQPVEQRLLGVEQRRATSRSTSSSTLPLSRASSDRLAARRASISWRSRR